MTDTTHHRICPLCEACCGLEITTDQGRVTSIRGHAQDVFSAGYICPKGVALKDLHEDPDRLRTPLIKRDGVHVPATWDEAFAEIERRLPAVIALHGRDATAAVVGNPAAHKIGLVGYFGKLARALGSKNVFSASTLDQMPKQLASGLMFGHWLSVALPDIVRTDLLLVIGANPLASNGSMWTVPDFKGKARAMQARGGRLIVIDPRRTETAAMADEHHFIRPGADVFLLAALVHTRRWHRSRPRQWRRVAASAPTPYGRWPAPWPRRHVRRCTPASAPAPKNTARWRAGWWTCSMCSPGTWTPRAAPCLRSRPPSAPTPWAGPAVARALPLVGTTPGSAARPR
jgi:formylmethanofuran dehydrogenase subunit B